MTLGFKRGQNTFRNRKGWIPSKGLE